MPVPSVKYLNTFKIAARRLSFTAASAELCLTASAVGQQIRVLESQLGVILFERHAQALRLTPAGQLLLEHVDSALHRLELVVSQLRTHVQRPFIKLQVPPFFAHELLLPRLAKFSAAQGPLELQVTTPPTALGNHSWDADVSVIVASAPAANLQATLLFPQVFVPACAPGLIGRMGLRSELDLSQQTLLVHNYRPDLWERWAAMRRIGSFQPRTIIRLDSMLEVARAAEQGIGIALLSAALAERRFASRALSRPIAAELSTGENYFLVARREDAARGAIAPLLAWLAAHCAAVAIQ
ncbi:MAG TPA: LysR substrate-binding domain-containing protein [Steroidobacteraceae bacterium]|nr:LysR substrate-binding domain-containing protein [Steroidobacteraceae bacterium]